MTVVKRNNYKMTELMDTVIQDDGYACRSLLKRLSNDELEMFMKIAESARIEAQMESLERACKGDR